MKHVRVHLPRVGPVTAEDFVAFSRGERVQVCDAFIESGDAPLALRLYLPQPEQAPYSISELQPADAALPVLVRDHEPSILAMTRASEHEFSQEVAAAVAVMRAAWAWDERPEFPIVVNEVPWLAAPRFDQNRRWNVVVRAAAG